MFFVIFFELFCLISLRLKFLKVDEGLLRDKIACYDHFMSYMSWYYKQKHKIFLALGIKKPPLAFDKGFDDRLLQNFEW